MPPLPRIRIGALADLAKQLRFAPRDTLRRQLERAEALVAEVEPGATYPEDWVVFRVTGYRAEMDEPAMLVGEALLADLPAFVERLSAGAGLAWDELEPGEFLLVDDLCRRWNVSRKTLDRWRRRGLAARRVRGVNGKPRLAFAISGIERFEARCGALIAGAGAFSRIPAPVEAQMIRRAAVYRRRLGWSLNRTAARLADRFERGHETVRQLLRRHDAGADRPIFGEKGVASSRERRMIDRAMRLGIEPGEIAARVGRSAAAVRRAASGMRAARLRSLNLAPEGGPPGAFPDHPEVGVGLGNPGETDVALLVRGARAARAPGAETERARAQAVRVLVLRSAAAIVELPAHGASAGTLDLIETDLRWAARLKAELVRSQLPLVLRTLETVLERPPEELRAALLGPLVARCIGAVGDAVDTYEPGRGGGRLAAPAGLALTRLVTRWAREHAGELRAGERRATPRLNPGTAIADWTLSVASWQSFLEPPQGVRRGLGALGARERGVLEARFGWGGPPRTMAGVAGLLSSTVMRAARMEREAIRAALRASRGPG